jgi:hypothetical protein
MRVKALASEWHSDQETMALVSESRSELELDSD